jgi:hypothetical protein
MHHRQVRLGRAKLRASKRYRLVRMLGVWGTWLTVAVKGRGMLIATNMVSKVSEAQQTSLL